MPIWIISLFTGKFSKWIFGGVGVTVAIGVIYLAGHNAGKDKCRNKHATAAIEQLQSRNEIEHEIITLPADELDARLARWMRD